MALQDRARRGVVRRWVASAAREAQVGALHESFILRLRIISVGPQSSPSFYSHGGTAHKHT